MSILDIVLGVILLLGVYSGWKNGLFVALASLVGLVLAVYGAVYFSDYAAVYIANWFNWNETTTNLAAFAVTFLVIMMVVSLLGKVLTKIADFAALGVINKLLGAAFNVLKYAFIVSVVFMFLNASEDLSGYVISEEKKENSKLYEPIASLAPMLLPRILEEVDTLDIPEMDLDDDEEQLPENPTQ